MGTDIKHLICHCSRGTEKSRFVTCHLSNALFKAIHRDVFLISLDLIRKLFLNIGNSDQHT
jgi:hypothetical protein